MMIDWLTLRIPCDHSREIAGGAMVSYKDAWDFDAGADWCFTKFVPKWYGLHLATLNDAEAVFECLLVVAYRAFPSELRVQAVGFAAAYLWPLKDYSKFK
ncbi:hypothetical protein LCV11_004479 [Salmonella enterica]|nr:hypothetical protein [Salmonella enterica]